MEITTQHRADAALFAGCDTFGQIISQSRRLPYSVNRADTIIRTAEQQALAQYPKVQNVGNDLYKLDTANRTAYQVGVLQGQIRTLCAELDALKNPTAKALGFHSEFSTSVGDADATGYFDVVRAEPDVGIRGGASLTAVFVRGADVTSALSKETIAHLESAAGEHAQQMADDLRADVAEHRRQTAKDDALEARL